MEHLATKKIALVCVLTMVATLAFTASPAAACSCAQVDPIDMIGETDAVFTATVTDGPGDPFNPVWTMEVDGVVKGELARQETVIGEDWGGGCGTDFGRAQGSIVVFADEDKGELRALGCMPLLTAGELQNQLDSIEQSTSTGPPVAVLFGRAGLTDIGLLDDEGQMTARANIGLEAGIGIHCPGTTFAALHTTEGQIHLIDLATLSVAESRDISIGSASITGDRVACLDGGQQLAVTTGYGLGESPIVVATSNAADSGITDLSKPFSQYSRAVFHPAGTALMLPSLGGEPLRALKLDDLEPVGDPVVLPEDAVALDGDVSPDGSLLAMLVSLDAELAYESAGTHVVTVGLTNGVPTEALSIVELKTFGESIETPEGQAKWIRWRDGSSVIIEHETQSAKRLQVIDTDGSVVLPLTTVDWGWSTVAIPTGILRSQAGGVGLVARDGTVTPGDPAPDNTSDRSFSIAALIDAPEFSVTTDSLSTPTITPLADDAPDTRFEGEPSDDPGIGEPAGDEQTPNLPWFWIGLASIVVGFALVARAYRRNAAGPR